MKLTHAIAVLGLLTLTACAHGPATTASETEPGMVLIPAGPFVMGTDQTDDASDAADYGLPYTLYDDATPSHTATVPAFYIDRYELTNAEYLQFLDGTEIPGIGAPYNWVDNRPPDGTGNHAVTGINWYEAQFACLYFGKRLPSEAEWEKAARGTDGRIYPWGNKFDETRANVAKGDRGKLMPVGSFPEGASPYGVEDMIGNAWEWTKSWYQPYPGSGHESEKYGKLMKVIRGNSYADPGHFPDEEARRIVVGAMSRANYRFYYPPTAKSPDSGVRCAKSVPVTP